MTRTSWRWLLVVAMMCLGALGGSPVTERGRPLAARYQLHERTARFFERAAQPVTATRRTAEPERKPASQSSPVPIERKTEKK